MERMLKFCIKSKNGSAEHVSVPEKDSPKFITNLTNNIFVLGYKARLSKLVKLDVLDDVLKMIITVVFKLFLL